MAGKVGRGSPRRRREYKLTQYQLPAAAGTLTRTLPMLRPLAGGFRLSARLLPAALRSDDEPAKTDDGVARGEAKTYNFTARTSCICPGGGVKVTAADHARPPLPPAAAPWGPARDAAG